MIKTAYVRKRRNTTTSGGQGDQQSVRSRQPSAAASVFSQKMTEEQKQL
jgi:hypothetical protein